MAADAANGEMETWETLRDKGLKELKVRALHDVVMGAFSRAHSTQRTSTVHSTLNLAPFSRARHISATLQMKQSVVTWLRQRVPKYEASFVLDVAAVHMPNRHRVLTPTTRTLTAHGLARTCRRATPRLPKNFCRMPSRCRPETTNYCSAVAVLTSSWRSGR